ncbi:hypothetical protein FB45DRAFT_1024073 [Roridomyces roridus]|uniref:Uncharacterized protein n=1 Tax=Roridomyces roridus TaxID=1738132 RepID=A0AAD7C5E1_9AGAR|nr:hypothetical protein FB45DRAFT_1024073 [Roridomyces roridus]
MSAHRTVPSPPSEPSPPESSPFSPSSPSSPSAPPSTPRSASHIIASATGDELLRGGNRAYMGLLRQQTAYGADYARLSRSYFRLAHYCKSVVELHCTIRDDLDSLRDGLDSLLRRCDQLTAFDPDEPVAREEAHFAFRPAIQVFINANACFCTARTFRLPTRRAVEVAHRI